MGKGKEPGGNIGLKQGKRTFTFSPGACGCPKNIPNYTTKPCNLYFLFLPCRLPTVVFGSRLLCCLKHRCVTHFYGNSCFGKNVHKSLKVARSERRFMHDRNIRQQLCGSGEHKQACQETKPTGLPEGVLASNKRSGLSLSSHALL